VRKSTVNWILCLLIGFSVLISNSKLVYASKNQADYEMSVNSNHIYEYPNDEGFPTWEILLNVSGPTPNSTLQEYNISLEFIFSGSQENVTYSNESLSLFINLTIISNSNSSQTNYTGNINDTLLLKEGDIVDAQFHCNSTKERIEEICGMTLGVIPRVVKLENITIEDKVIIFLECNVTLGGDTEGLHTVDTGWFIENPDCHKSAPILPGYPTLVLIGCIGITLVVVVLRTWKSVKRTNF